MEGTLVRGVGMTNHDMTFNLDSAKVCSPAIYLFV